MVLVLFVSPNVSQQGSKSQQFFQTHLITRPPLVSSSLRSSLLAARAASFDLADAALVEEPIGSAAVEAAVPLEEVGVGLDGAPGVGTAVGAGCAAGCCAGHGWVVEFGLGWWVVRDIGD